MYVKVSYILSSQTLSFQVIMDCASPFFENLPFNAANTEIKVRRRKDGMCVQSFTFL